MTQMCHSAPHPKPELPLKWKSVRLLKARMLFSPFFVALQNDVRKDSVLVGILNYNSIVFPYKFGVLTPELVQMTATLQN